jgi:hypothetical protein
VHPRRLLSMKHRFNQEVSNESCTQCDHSHSASIPQSNKTGRHWSAIAGHTFKLVALWAAFSSFMATVAVCPFCGRSGCPVGIGFAGVAGGFLTFLLRGGRAIAGSIWRLFHPPEHKTSPNSVERRQENEE